MVEIRIIEESPYHKSCNNHLEFLSKEFVEMIQKGQ